MADQRKKMNVVQLTFIVAVNMMGSGIIMLPTNMAKVGAISLLSWVVTALGSMAMAYGFAQAGIYNQRPGGLRHTPKTLTARMATFRRSFCTSCRSRSRTSPSHSPRSVISPASFRPDGDAQLRPAPA
jgi:putrescine:ornithine antiporter